MQKLIYILILSYICDVHCRKHKETENSGKSAGSSSEGNEEIFGCKDKHDKSSGKKIDKGRCMSTLANYPFSVSIQQKGIHFSSGALIDKRWILSAASEFYNVRESIKWFRARMGSVNCKKGGVLIPLTSILIHPVYHHRSSAHDLALLKLATPVNETQFIRPIGLSKVHSKVLAVNFLVTYWPRLIVNGEVLRRSAKERTKGNNMRVSVQKMESWDKCYDTLHEQGDSLNKNSLCLKPITMHHSPCMPDVGAPVVAEDGLWGITSGWISKKCHEASSPTIVTRISSPVVRSWLHKQLA